MQSITQSALETSTKQAPDITDMVVRSDMETPSCAGRINSTTKTDASTGHSQVSTKPHSERPADKSAESEQSNTVDRRRFPRRPSRCRIKVVTKADATQRLLNPLWAFRTADDAVQIVDISMTSIAFLSETGHTVGEELLIHLHNGDHNQNLVVDATVLSTQPIMDGLEQIVCEFATPLCYRDLEQVTSFLWYF